MDVRNWVVLLGACLSPSIAVANAPTRGATVTWSAPRECPQENVYSDETETWITPRLGSLVRQRFGELSVLGGFHLLLPLQSVRFGGHQPAAVGVRVETALAWRFW